MINRLLLLCFSVVTLHSSTYSQQNEWPPKNWKDGSYKGLRDHHIDLNGRILFTNNDTLKGNIRLYLLIDDISILQQNETEGRQLKNREIDRIKYIELDTVVNGRQLVYEGCQKEIFGDS